MEKEQFKGFEDLIVKNGLWTFKGENTWSKDIDELWKWVELAREKVRGLMPHPFELKFSASDFGINSFTENIKCY